MTLCTIGNNNYTAADGAAASYYGNNLKSFTDGDGAPLSHAVSAQV